jgi:hypothetical protein
MVVPPPVPAVPPVPALDPPVALPPVAPPTNTLFSGLPPWLIGPWYVK